MNEKRLTYLKENEPDTHAEVVKILEQRDALLVALDELINIMPTNQPSLNAAIDTCHRVRREMAAEATHDTPKPHVIKSKYIVEETGEPVLTLAEVLNAIEEARHMRTKHLGCVHCKWESEYRDRMDADGLLRDHIKTCPEHPMRALEQEISELKSKRQDA